MPTSNEWRRSRRVKKLDLSLTYVSDAGAEAIGKAAQLEELNLFTAEFITDAAVAFLRGNTNLRVLNLRGTDVTDTSLEYVSKLANLRSLDISFTQIGDVGMEHLAPLSQLEELNVGGMKISGSALHVLKYLPNLKRLSFYGVQRRNAGMCWAPVMTDIELDTIALLTGLEELNIGDGVALGAPRPDGARSAGGRGRMPHHGRHTHHRFRPREAREPQETAFPESERLGRHRQCVLKTLAGLPNLQRLSLWNVEGINDSAAAGFESLQSVTSLDLSNTGIGDRTHDGAGEAAEAAAALHQRHGGHPGGGCAHSSSNARRLSCPGGPASTEGAARGLDQSARGVYRMKINGSRVLGFSVLGSPSAVAALAALISLPVVEAQAPAPSFATTVYPVLEKAELPCLSYRRRGGVGHAAAFPARDGERRRNRRVRSHAGGARRIATIRRARCC